MRKVRLGEIANVDISGIDKKTKDGEQAVRLCNFTDVYYNWAITKNMYDGLMLASASESDIKTFSLRKGQVAITKDSETRDDIGVATYIADDFEDVVLGYHCALITPKMDIPEKERIYGKYLNALLHTKYAQKYFSNNATGSGQRYTLSKEAIEDMLVYLPTYEEQVRIGNYLSDIDNKIELNNLINAELEAMAKQIYDYWFVQFDFPNKEGKPYKSSGGKMVLNENLKREVPEGWYDGSLGEMCKLYQPQTIGSNEISEIGQYRVYGANGRIGYYNKYNHQHSEIVMACRGNSCGVVNRTMPYSWITGNAMVLQLKDEMICNDFIYHSVCYMNIKGAITGSGQPQITRENLAPVKTLIPSKDILLEYTSISKYIVQLVIKYNEEIDDLKSLRDYLLPLLMNGQLTIKD